ncbi:hypothetical protein BLNAU_17410 [Blattamonas nauphoetae]|uniref:Uncharacterized protein n=1 Tax=Blattamonas nauphoetae TaxID=2049346 RepID=A0ABQ9X8T7_9EUKA|nr:hypothetical protein BLNAU_17410 [Blattamonas nauphoetae]
MMLKKVEREKTLGFKNRMTFKHILIALSRARSGKMTKHLKVSNKKSKRRKALTTRPRVRRQPTALIMKTNKTLRNLNKRVRRQINIHFIQQMTETLSNQNSL